MGSAHLRNARNGGDALAAAPHATWRTGPYAYPRPSAPPLFVASVSFFVTFLGVRLLVAAITHHIGPFGWVTFDGRHIHHLVWGILILLAVGYAWLADAGSGSTPTSIFISRLLAILYGVGAALTLDEFALWLNLSNVYWSPQGRESIDAVILFGAVLAAGAWGAPLLSALKRRK